MQIIQSAIMGLVQGITEFLPVSSSGHIVISSAIYKLMTGKSVNSAGAEEIFFDILIHLATLAAVIIYFRADLIKMIKSSCIALKAKNFNDENLKTVIFIFAATFVTSLAGLLIKDLAHNIVENPFAASCLLIVTGGILYFCETIKKSEKPFNLKIALIVGLFQGLAILPGLSRSGLTISSAMLCGIKRFEAAKFSFILSIPVIILASIFYPLIEIDFSKPFGLIEPLPFAVGILTSFVSGYFCIKYFMHFIQKSSLKVFSYYCITVGIISSILFLCNL